ncbi:MAG: YggU family protein [Proteobacteria bacterium]|nr:YggU family protein [Pseudomonadota bacterium]
MASFFHHADEGWVLNVHLTPNASRDEITGTENHGNKSGRLKVKVRAVPEKGKANQALCRLLAKYFKLPKSSLEVISGHKSRTKRVLIRGASEDFEKKLGQILKGLRT